jgi:UDP:flavonoid glycosyltransferase YjiC (YdhE family)
MNNTELIKHLAGKKILFANFPADGHFNPLTGLAIYLQDLGCDVRWYTSDKYAPKLKQMGIPHIPMKAALDISDVDSAFPEREKIKGMVAKLRFDITNIFILRGPEYYADLLQLHRDSFAFDLLIADCAFTGVPFVKDLMKIPVIGIGVLPLTETSKDLPPSGLGMTPSYSLIGKIKQALLRKISDNILFKHPNKVLHEILDKYNVPHNRQTVFDLLPKKTTLFLQSGTPGFEYYRSDLSNNIRFAGALLPFSSKRTMQSWFDKRLTEYKKMVIVTQGTIERNIEKIIVPTLEALKDTDTLVIATTGGSGTQELQKRFPQKNIIIADFIPFSEIMPYADAYITNGGYGGVMLGIENKVPMIVAGVHEGKNEINARVGYFKLGINLRKENPTSGEIKKAVSKLFGNNTYKQNLDKLAKEFATYNPNKLCAYYAAKLLQQQVEQDELFPELAGTV